MFPRVIQIRARLMFKTAMQERDALRKLLIKHGLPTDFKLPPGQ